MNRRPGSRSYQVSFAGGEVSPEMFGRIDDARRQSGAAAMRNMIATPQGAAVKRPGTQFVREVKDSTKATRLIPFAYSTDQSIAIEMGDGYFRFHTDGATVIGGDPLVATVQTSGVNFSAGVMQFNFATAHGFRTGDEVTVLLGIGGAMPTGLSQFVQYYAIYVDSTHIQIADTRAEALIGSFKSFASAGSSPIFVARVYQVGEYITYVSSIYKCVKQSLTGTPPNTVALTVTQAGSTFTTGAAHGLFEGTSIVFTFGGGSSLSGVVSGTEYFAIPVTNTTFQVSATYGGAAMVLVGGHVGAPTVNRSTHWSLQPADSPFEVTHPYTESELFDVGFAQSNDVMVFTHPNHTVRTLSRLGATTWFLDEETFDSSIAAPSGAAFTATGLGQGVGIDGASAVTALQALQEHGLAVGQVLYNYTAFFNLAAGFYVNVENATDFVFNVRLLDGSSPTITVTATDGTINGTLYLCSAGDEVGGTYVVTAVSATGQESDPSAEATHGVVLGSPGAFATLTWDEVSGAENYRIYKKNGDNFGLIGQTVGTEFTDDGLFTVDTGIRPPIRDTRVSESGRAPSTVAFYEQRVLFGGLRDYPQDVWGTASGTTSDASYHIPVQDSDRIYFQVASLQRSAIRHIVPMDQLIILTDTTEFRVTPINDDALTPTSVSIRPQSYVGSSKVRPVVSGVSMVFAANRGGHLYEMSYSSVSNGFEPDDISIRAAHLFDDHIIQDSTFSRAPWPVMWFCSSSGQLLGLTYVRNQNIGAWHAHETGGDFESCCAIPEGDQDSVYVIVNRNIDGSDVRYVERMVFDYPVSLEDGFYVDSGLTYSGAATTTITGLDHLEGEDVVALADGVVRSGLVVNGGNITLPVAASLVHIGLQMTAKLQSLPAALQVDGYGQGSTKAVNKVWLRVVDSAQFEAGPDEDRLVPAYKLSGTTLESKPVRVVLKGAVNAEGQVLIQQSVPLPLKIVSMTLDVEDADN